MALDDFAPSTPEEDDLFNFAEVEVEPDSSDQVSTSSSDEEIMEAVHRAAAEVQDELAPLQADEGEDIDEDELVASFPEGMLDGDDDDLFSFDDLLSDDTSPVMDASIVDDEDRYGLTAQQVADHPDYSDADEASEEGSALTEEPSTKKQVIQGSADTQLESASSVSDDAPAGDSADDSADDFDFAEQNSVEEEDDLYAESAIDREAEAEEFASLLSEPQADAAPELTTGDSASDEIQPAPRREGGPESAEAPESKKTLKGATGRVLERFALQSDSGKPLYLLVGSFLALNLILAVLAIFAFFRVGSGLQGMKTSLAGSLETIAREAQRSEERNATPAPTDQETEATAQEAAQESKTLDGTAHVHLEPRERTELRAARAEIAAGKFQMARRRLFQLLAVADSPLSEEGRIAEEEANLLVAESFEVEAQAFIELQERLREEALREQRP